MFDHILKIVFSIKSKNELNYPDLVKQALDSQLPVYSLWMVIKARVEHLKHAKLHSSKMLNGWINTSQSAQISKLENEVQKLRQIQNADNEKSIQPVKEINNQSDSNHSTESSHKDLDVNTDTDTDIDIEKIQPTNRKPVRNNSEYFIVLVLIVLFLILFFLISRMSREQYKTDEIQEDYSETIFSESTTNDTDYLESLLVFVRGGTFIMGCTSEQGDDCWDDEKPSHTIRISDFYISKYEITVSQFAQFVRETGYVTQAEQIGGCHVFKNGNWEMQNGLSWRNSEAGKNITNSKNQFPVVCISWHDAMAYCDWLSEQTDFMFRLPTEAEWEYAARGGSSAVRTKYSGSNNIGAVAWYTNNSNKQPQEVGQKKANELGLYDMSGNVWEWCGTLYQPYDSSLGASQFNDDSNGEKVLRGGSWFNLDRSARVSHRGYRPREYQSNTIGFRVIREVN